MVWYIHMCVHTHMHFKYMVSVYGLSCLYSHHLTLTLLTLHACSASYDAGTVTNLQPHTPRKLLHMECP